MEVTHVVKRCREQRAAPSAGGDVNQRQPQVVCFPCKQQGRHRGLPGETDKLIISTSAGEPGGSGGGQKTPPLPVLLFSSKKHDSVRD